MEKFIRISSAKFPILPGEDQELVNEGMYGKALGQYMLNSLRQLQCSSMVQFAKKIEVCAPRSFHQKFSFAFFPFCVNWEPDSVIL